MRIMVTGGKGMLGTDLCALFASLGHEVIPVDIGDFDICGIDSTLETVRAIKPNFIIHTAAHTDVDGCERTPDIAYRVNAIGSGNIAAGAADVGAAIVAISTDFVFDGEKGTPYTEFDSPNPLGVYGASKLAGENMVRDACPKHFVVRTSWLFGRHGKCFPKTMLQLAETRNEITVVADQYGTPTYTVDLANAIADIIKTPIYGTYHVSNSGYCSWHGFAEKLFSLAEKSHVTVKRLQSDDWPSPTRRPKFSALRNYVRELQGKPAMRSWEEAVIDYLSA